MSKSTLQPLIVVDAGNTRVKLGVFDRAKEDARTLPSCGAFAAVRCGEALPIFELLAQTGGPQVGAMRGAVTGSNPPEVERVVREWPADWPAPNVVANRSQFGLKINVDYPEKVGIDRLLNAVAANVLRGERQPAVIIDSGTATTVDHISPRGAFCGGAILPGFDLCAKALHEYTALLPLVQMSQLLDEAQPLELGRNTEAAITSGLYWGHVGAVKELMRRLMHARSSDAGDPGPSPAAASELPLLLLTGGAAPLLLPHLPTFVRHEPHLALQGLALVALRET